MLSQKSKIFKIGLSLAVVLLLTGVGAVTHHIFFREIEIKIEQIDWVDEFKIEIPEIKLKDEPCFLVIKPKNSEIIGKKLQIQKQNIKIGHCANNRILVPLRVRSEVKGNENLFFVPQFRARITGVEKLKANFSLYLKATQCQKDQEKIKGKDFVLCNVGVSSSNVRSFSIAER